MSRHSCAQVGQQVQGRHGEAGLEEIGVEPLTIDGFYNRSDSNDDEDQDVD